MRYKSLFLSPEGDAGGQAPETFTKAQVDALLATEVKGLKDKNSELLGKFKEFETQLEPFKGLDAKAARDALAARDQVEADKRKALGDWDANEKKLRDDWSKEHTGIVDPLKKALAERDSELFEAVAMRDALEAMSNKDVKANPKLAMPLIRHELDTIVVDGKRVTVIKGADGKPRYHATSGALVTVADRLKELRTVPDYFGAFEGIGTSGGGAEAGAAAMSGEGIVTLTRAQASDAPTYQAALKKVGGDYSKVKVKD